MSYCTALAVYLVVLFSVSFLLAPSKQKQPVNARITMLQGVRNVLRILKQLSTTLCPVIHSMQKYALELILVCVDHALFSCKTFIRVLQPAKWTARMSSLQLHHPRRHVRSPHMTISDNVYRVSVLTVCKLLTFKFLVILIHFLAQLLTPSSVKQSTNVAALTVKMYHWMHITATLVVHTHTRVG
jgi:hypothetical protein